MNILLRNGGFYPFLPAFPLKWQGELPQRGKSDDTCENCKAQFVSANLLATSVSKKQNVLSLKSTALQYSNSIFACFSPTSIVANPFAGKQFMNTHPEKATPHFKHLKIRHIVSILPARNRFIRHAGFCPSASLQKGFLFSSKISFPLAANPSGHAQITLPYLHSSMAASAMQTSVSFRVPPSP